MLFQCALLFAPCAFMRANSAAQARFSSTA